MGVVENPLRLLLTDVKIRNEGEQRTRDGSSCQIRLVSLWGQTAIYGITFQIDGIADFQHKTQYSYISQSLLRQLPPVDENHSVPLRLEKEVAGC